MRARNALDSVAAEHEMQLEQARQQAVAEYCAKAMSETANLSDTSVLVDLQASNAVSSCSMCCTCSISFYRVSCVKVEEEIDGKVGDADEGEDDDDAEEEDERRMRDTTQLTMTAIAAAAAATTVVCHTFRVQKNPGFFKKAQPFWVLLGLGLYWVFRIFLFERAVWKLVG